MRKDFLHKLGFTTDNGLVHHLDEAKNNVERLYIGEAKKLDVPADAVFFRRFYKEDSDDSPYFSIPAVCVFNQSDVFFNTEPHKKLHAALWSAGKTEIYIILGETRVDVINARKPAKRIGEEVTLEAPDLTLAQEVIEKFEGSQFSAHLFGTGTFWEQSDMREKIDENSNPYIFLLDYLMEGRKKLISDTTIKLPPAIIDKLLITCILIKFLEEIKDDAGKHTLQSVYRKHKIQTGTFEEGLRKRAYLNILNDLANEFNGKIFDTFSQGELAEIANANLNPMADFLSANIDVKTGQGFLWKQYSFQHLPAEVISAIYENFIQADAERSGEKKKDVVYTPLHLVNLMIDEAMPLHQPELFENNRFRVLDPACGSGVFLVAAYKRMLQWWAINHWRKTKEIAYPNKKVAQKILEDNIFGVDIEKVAAIVSIFGLTTAFLDKLTPKEIWNNLKFKNLGEQNIRGVNFSDWAKKNIQRKHEFELVIGNPPFNDSKKGTITNQELIDLFGRKVPGNKPALKFFESALYFGKRVCMIIPSNVFLYNKSKPSHEYRKIIFTDYTVRKIYDFTHLRESLFVKKNVRRISSQKKAVPEKTGRIPVLALMIYNQPSNHQSIEHVVVKRETLSEQKLIFEIDYYDKHHVSWNWAIDESKQFVWKTNLLGGGRLFHLVYRLSLLGTLRNFIEEKKKENPEWIFEVGYETGTPKKKIFIPYLSNQDKISKIGKDGSIYSNSVETNEYFYRPKVESLFRPPLIIINKKLGNSFLPIGLVRDHSREFLIFNSSYLGIHGPANQLADLERIYDFLKTNERFCRFWIISQSPSTLINQETSFKKQDIDTLPFGLQKQGFQFSESEKILQNDTLDYYIHLGKGITRNSAGKILHDPVLSDELRTFGTTYCEALNEIYAQDGKSWQAGEMLQTPNFVRYQFGFGRNGGLKNELRNLDGHKFHSLLENTSPNGGVKYQRIFRHYRHESGYDCVYLIKPRARRYWLCSIALRDVDDTFMDLKKAGF